MNKSTLQTFLETTESAYTNQNRALDYDEAQAVIGSPPARKASLNKESWNRALEKIQRAKEHEEAMSNLKKETVNHPDHYNKGIETIDYIESWDMDFNQGNVIKYVSRYVMKGGLEDLKKAQWYLERLIQKEEKSV
jgi:hypothetical protein